MSRQGEFFFTVYQRPYTKLSKYKHEQFNFLYPIFNSLFAFSFFDDDYKNIQKNLVLNFINRDMFTYYIDV